MIKNNQLKITILILAFMLSFLSCATIPDGIKAIEDFQKEKYLGKWYEIARFDFVFEKNLDHTTATYSLNENGTIKVDNQGYNIKTKKWQQAIGKAKFVKTDDIAMLKVSFFGPFYAGYNVIAIDKDYRYALICGDDLKYLWILSKEKNIPEDVKNNYVSLAENLGFEIQNLIWVNQD